MTSSLYWYPVPHPLLVLELVFIHLINTYSHLKFLSIKNLMLALY